jgi:putative heme-binding domain-containing protein
MYPTMQDMGGGSGTGALFIDEPTLPAPYDKALITVDWGRNEIYRQPLASNGAGFTVEQQLMLKTPRPTDIDIDASGRLYVSSWKDGGFSYSGPNVGFVACLTPKHATPAATPNFQQASDAQLLQLLAGPSHVIRTHAQWELLRRGDKPELAQGLEQLATQAPSLEAKVAAIFTLKQLQGAKSHAALVRLAQAHADIREWALRALTDRKSQLEGVPATVLVKALQDTNPRVRAQAAISLGRLGDAAQGAAILPLTADADATVRHVALRALAALQPTQALLNAVTAHDSAAARGALQALRYVHQAAAVEGLIAKVESVTDPALRREVLTTLTRLYYQEGEWPGDWWGTRPDTTGPYYRRAAWSETPKIEAALAKVLATADAETVVHLRQQIQRHSIKSTALEPDETSNVAATGPSVDLTKLLSSNQVVPDSIATLSFEDALKQTLRHNGDAQAGAKLYVSQGCVQCHTISPDQKPLGPMLRDISKRYNRTELVTSILKPSDKIAQGFATTTIITADGQLRSGIVASEGAEDLTLLAPTGQTVVVVKEDIEDRAENTVSTMPEGLANNLTPAQLASLLAFLETLKSE